MFHDLVRKNRSYRRFEETEAIGREELLTLVDYARLTPSGANKQALKYYIASEKTLNEKVFHTLAWAAYLKDWNGPEPGERPSAYIVIVQEADYKMGSVYDCGIAAQTILLGAVEMGFGGCMLGNVKREELKQVLSIPDNQEILLVLALGKPKEEVIVEELASGGDIRYWRDETQRHHVPKRSLEDIVLN
ncbi:MAG: nitroreductase family protein [Sporomusaceae bacterium]|nr:nitroreductase family protein [Sporomusaceae bacterium]